MDAWSLWDDGLDGLLGRRVKQALVVSLVVLALLFPVTFRAFIASWIRHEQGVVVRQIKPLMMDLPRLTRPTTEPGPGLPAQRGPQPTSEIPIPHRAAP